MIITKFNAEVKATNASAIAFIMAIRLNGDNYMKTFTLSYARELAKVCNYIVADSGKSLILGMANKTKKEFKSNKEACRFMESTINDLFNLGILC